MTLYPTLIYSPTATLHFHCGFARSFALLSLPACPLLRKRYALVLKRRTSVRVIPTTCPQLNSLADAFCGLGSTITHLYLVLAMWQYRSNFPMATFPVCLSTRYRHFVLLYYYHSTHFASLILGLTYTAGRVLRLRRSALSSPPQLQLTTLLWLVAGIFPATTAPPRSTFWRCMQFFLAMPLLLHTVDADLPITATLPGRHCRTRQRAARRVTFHLRCGSL